MGSTSIAEPRECRLCHIGSDFLSAFPVTIPASSTAGTVTTAGARRAWCRVAFTELPLAANDHVAAQAATITAH